MGLYTLSFRVDKNTVALVYLAEIYHIDLTTLLLLYDKLRDDVFYFFYLFGGCQVGFPKAGKLLKILKFGQAYCDLHVKNKPIEGLATSQQERKVLEKLQQLYHAQSRLFRMTTEVVNTEDTEVETGKQTALRDDRPIQEILPTDKDLKEADAEIAANSPEE